ncbi:hypothetical protein RhiXN_04480 [Rhizoctonia solani]|uniref:Uncharacterized protein n=1 Tax=Rhizoctonia solani TaxID=456999 RepID=A0A8H8SSD7_9AGAM|nr:uncharacterized protein RhiXN_04480 [Rhizoctonia solani]QRW16479.1 hypothetical protein RhiXN_04480 [Rhizoctonia solani]
MDSFFKKAQQALEQVVDSQNSGGGDATRDKYVDTFAPSVSSQVSREISTFQDATLQSLENHIKAVFEVNAQAGSTSITKEFQAVFRGDFSMFQGGNSFKEFIAARERSQDAAANQHQAQYGAGLPDFNYPTPQQRSGERALPEYGTRGLPFAGNLGNQERNVFQAALNKVTDFAKSADNEIGGKVATVAQAINGFNIDPTAKAQESPRDPREVDRVLTDLHAPLADQLTNLALTQVKNFLKGSITTGSSVKGRWKALEDYAPGGGSNPVPDAPGGFVGLLSEKLSDGLTVIRAHTRQDFRRVLGDIEEKLFDSLPNEISGPLMAVLGGNPFSDDERQQQARGGGGFNILDEVKDKLRVIIERIQKGLRDRVLEVVSGGHRKLEDKAWGNVQDAIVTKVQKFVPGIQVKLDD